MEIGKQPSNELLNFCGQTIKRVLFEMSQNKPNEDIAIMANILMTDLNDKFHRLTQQDVTQAFHIGVRTTDQLAINPRTWFNWLNVQKLKSNATRINSAQTEERENGWKLCLHMKRKGVIVSREVAPISGVR